MYNHNVSEKVRALSKKLEAAKDEQEFFDVVTGFYKAYGVGMFGLNKAFRIEEHLDGGFSFMPINNMDAVMLDDLIGYEIQKKKLTDNTEAFVQAKRPTMCCFSETAEPENQQASRPLSISIMMTDCA